MTINLNASAQELDLITEIAIRACQMAEKQGHHLDRLHTLMDITACHLNGCPLKLEELRKATPFDFSHDIAGIINHLNRETGKLENGFWPRYASN